MAQLAPEPSPFDVLLQEYGEVLREAEQLRIESTRRLVELEARASQLKAKLASAAPSPAPLPNVPPAGNVVAAMPKTQVRKYAVRSRHAFPRTVGNVAKWAAEQDPPVPVSTARSWYTTDRRFARPIPEPYCLQLERTHGIPRSAWKNGVTRDVRPRKKRPDSAGQTAKDT